MRELKAEIDSFSADAAYLLRGVDLLLVRFKLQAVRAVSVRPLAGCVSWVGHGVLLSGIKIAPLRCFCVL